MTKHFEPDAFLERRLRDARDAQNEHLRFAASEAGGHARKLRRVAPGACAIAVIAGLSLLAFAWLHTPRSAQADADAEPGISTLDLTHRAGVLPAGDAYDAH